MHKLTELFKNTWVKWLAIFVAMLTVLMAVGISVLSSCDDKDDFSEESSVSVHVHKYAEEVTISATCLDVGVKTYTCDCGDIYEEEISALGHAYKNYICTYCAEEIKTSEGLLFGQYPEGGMVLSGIGECTDTEIIVPAMYKDSPVTSIMGRVFRGSTTLKSVTLPDTLRSISDSAFSGCIGLVSVNIPDGVTQINNWTFQNCSSLTSIIIPKGVTRIGIRAFYGCSSLTSITFKGTMEQWNVIFKDLDWNYNVPATEVVCSDGNVVI